MSNFQPLEVVGRGSETQLQVGENLNKITLYELGKYYAYLYIICKCLKGTHIEKIICSICVTPHIKTV